MNDFLNVPNPDKIIHDSIEYAIKNKEDKIKKIKNDIDSMVAQKQNDKFYANINTDDKTTAHYLGIAIIAIISDILSGFIEAIERVQENTKKFGLDNNEYGYNLDKHSNILHNSATTAKERINELSDKIMKGGIGGNIVKRAYDRVGNNRVGNNRVDNNRVDNNRADNNREDLDISKYDNLIPAETLSKIKDISEASIKTGIKWSGDFINAIIDMGLNFTGEYKILDTPIDELSPELNKKLILLSAILREFSSNPSTRTAIKDIAESLTITAVELLEEMRPALNIITDESLDLLDEAGEKYARGITNTGISMGQAFIAEIPWLGGIIDLLLALGKGFNVIMQTYEILVYKGGPLFVDTTKIFHDIKGISERGNIRIDTALKKYFDSNKNDNRISTVSNRQFGGVNSDMMYTPCKKTERRIASGGKRIRKTMKLFQSTLPKIKYPFSCSRNNRKKRTRKRVY